MQPALRVPVQQRSQKTRAAVLSAASREFSERGYAVTTAKSIAERAGVGTGTFYHYFPDKDAVLREIATERVQHLLEATEPLWSAPVRKERVAELYEDARARLERLVEIYVGYHRGDRGLHTVVTERRTCDAGLDAIMSASERDAVGRLSHLLQAAGYDGDEQATAFMLFSLLEGAVHGHVLTQAMVSDERFVAGLVDAMVRIAIPGKWLARLIQKGSEVPQ